jgi:lipopolysaccharide exporter
MIKKLKPKSEFSKNVLTLMTGTTIAQAIPIAISPILTRIYTPEDFGLLALYMAIATIIAVIATGRYELAIMLPKKDSDAVSIVVLSILFSFAVSVVILVLIFFYNAELASLLGDNEIRYWLFLLPVTVFITGTYNALNYWVNRKKGYTDISKNKVLQSFTIVATQVSMGLNKMGVAGLIWAGLVGQISALIFFLRLSWKNDKKTLKKVSRIKVIALAKRYKDFPLINSWSGLLNTASVQAPIIVLASLFSSTVTGYFSLAQRILQIPMTLLGAAIGQVYFEKATKLKANKSEIKRITLDTHKKLLIIGLLPTLIILLFGSELFAFIFGEPWRVAGEYAKLLSVWIFFVFVCSPLSHLMTIYEKHVESIIFNILLFTSRIGVLFIGWWLMQDAYQTIAIFGIVGALLWLGFIFYLMKLAGVSYIETARQISYTLVLIMPAAYFSF